MSSYFNINLNYSDYFSDVFVKEYVDECLGHSVEGKTESLYEHSNLTYKLFNKIVESLNLRHIIIGLLTELYEDLGFNEEYLSKANFLKFLGKHIMRIIFFHDIGKLNYKFQEKISSKKMAITDKSLKSFILNIFYDNKHSKYSMLFLNYFLLQNIEDSQLFIKYQKTTKFDERQECLKSIYYLVYLCVLLNSTAERHHSSLYNVRERVREIIENESPLIKKMNKAKMIFRNDPLTYLIDDYVFDQVVDDFWGDLNDKYSLLYLYKLIYSLILVGDSYATHAFYSKKSISKINFAKITSSMLSSIWDNFHSNMDYNKRLLNKNDVKRIVSTPANQLMDLNSLRFKLLVESSKNIREALERDEKRIFFLNVPTGGGKTNISMKMALDILKKREETVNRIYYVFPYVNIIEQNYAVILETLTNSEEEFISKVYSYNEWDYSKEGDEEEEYLINQQFLNNPINVISNVNFFNTFIKRNRRTNCKLAFLPNSVVIIDEIQTLPNADWEYFSKLLKEIAEKYNIYFILMSATLPDLSKFVTDQTIFYNIIKDPHKYFQHPKFKRASYVVEIDKKVTKKYFKERIESMMVSYNKYQKILCVVNTVQKSYELYTYLKTHLKKEKYELYLLNSTILSDRRREIIQKFKNKELSKNLVLVSTQSVEAGVDIDCNFGFREYGPLDSIEQVAGRINRESNRNIDDSKLYIFDFGTAHNVYRSDRRLKIQELHKKEFKQILDQKNYNQYYEYVINYLKQEEDEYKAGYSALLVPSYKLQFTKLSKYDYIQGRTASLFLPVEMSLETCNLTKGEKEYLNNHGMVLQNKISGENVWNLTKLINQESDKKRFVEIKKTQSILNKFTINLFNRYIGERRYKKTLVDYIKDQVNIGTFQEFCGYIKVSKRFLHEIGYLTESGLQPKKLSEYYEKQMDFFT